MTGWIGLLKNQHASSVNNLGLYFRLSDNSFMTIQFKACTHDHHPPKITRMGCSLFKTKIHHLHLNVESLLGDYQVKQIPSKTDKYSKV